MSVRTPSELQCREVVEVVTDFLGDEMPPRDRARIEQHLLVCPPCASHVAQVRSTIAHVGTLKVDAAPNPELLALFRQWHARGGHE